MDKRTQRTKGFGFVDFETIEAATLVMENMSQYEIDGQQLKVDIVEKEKKKRRSSRRKSTRCTRTADEGEESG